MGDKTDTILKPCPFCGHTSPHMVDNSDERREEHYVICKPTCVWGPSRGDVIEAAEAWNARV